MANVNVEVTNAVVSGKGHGETLALNEDRAKKLEGYGYVRILGAVASKDTTAKKTAQAKAKPATKDTKSTRKSQPKKKATK